MNFKNLFNKSSLLKTTALTAAIVAADGIAAQNTPSSDPFQDTTRTSDVFFQRSFMVEYHSNGNGGALPQRTQWGLSNQSYLNNALGARLSIDAGPKQIVDIGFEFAPKKEAMLGYVTTPLRLKGKDYQRTFLNQRSSLETAFKVGGFGQKNGDGSTDWGAMVAAEAGFTVFFNQQVGLSGGASLALKQSLLGSTPGRETNVIPQFFLGLRYIPKV